MHRLEFVAFSIACENDFFFKCNFKKIILWIVCWRGCGKVVSVSALWKLNGLSRTVKLSILHLSSLLSCMRPVSSEKGKNEGLHKMNSFFLPLQAEESLKRLRQALHLRLPIQEITNKD